MCSDVLNCLASHADFLFYLFSLLPIFLSFLISELRIVLNVFCRTRVTLLSGERMKETRLVLLSYWIYKMLSNLIKWKYKSPSMWKALFSNVLIWQIEVGDVICEIETDKATLEFECLEEGYIHTYTALSLILQWETSLREGEFCYTYLLGAHVVWPKLIWLKTVVVCMFALIVSSYET